jgi:hypothetical protein
LVCPANAVLADAVEATADDIRTRRALDHKPCLRGFAETRYQAQSWNQKRRACARIEAITRGLDIRFVVTSLETGSAEHVTGLASHRGFAAERSARGPLLGSRLASPKTGENRLATTGHFI